MAAHHLSRKLTTYDALHRANRSLAAVSRHVRRLERAGFMPIVQMKVFQGLIHELQAQISHAVLDKMYAVEDRDMFGFGKTRIRWEHHLNPRRPNFRTNFSKLERM